MGNARPVTNTLGVWSFFDHYFLIDRDAFACTATGGLLDDPLALIPAVCRVCDKKLENGQIRITRWTDPEADRLLLVAFIRGAAHEREANYLRYGPDRMRTRPFAPAQGLVRRGDDAWRRFVARFDGHENHAQQIALKLAMKRFAALTSRRERGATTTATA